MQFIIDSFLIYMPFLYFPEDKSEYIPAFFTLSIFIIITIIAFQFIKRVSAKQELKTKELEEKINNERQNQKL